MKFEKKITISKKINPFSSDILLTIFKRKEVSLDESERHGNCTLRINNNNNPINSFSYFGLFGKCIDVKCENCFWNVYNREYKGKRRVVFDLLKMGGSFDEI